MDPVKSLMSNQGHAIDTGKNRVGQDDDFLKTLKSYVYQVDHQIKETDEKVKEFAVGKRHDIHEIMIAGEKSHLSFKLLMQVRNKLLEAYHEIMRMQF